MGKISTAMAIVAGSAILASCAGPASQAPKNIDELCRVFGEVARVESYTENGNMVGYVFARGRTAPPAVGAYEGTLLQLSKTYGTPWRILHDNANYYEIQYRVEDERGEGVAGCLYDIRANALSCGVG